VTQTAKVVARILRRRKEKSLRIYVEEMVLDIEEQEDAESDITTNFGHRSEIVSLFHGLTEGI
jgi:hypothetical protein